MQPPDDRVREHRAEGLEVRLVGAAPVVRVNRRHQWWRSSSAIALGVCLATVVAVVLTSASARGTLSLAASATAEEPTLRQMLKEQPRPRCDCCLLAVVVLRVFPVAF